MSQKTRSGLQRLRVPIGFVTAILFLLLATPSWSSLALGLPITIAGLAFRGWASGHLKKNADLAVSGPYQYTRNPLYFGSFLMLLGVLVGGGNVWMSVALIALFLFIYYSVMRSEEMRMRELFPNVYQQWADAVPLFLPRFQPYRLDQAEPGRGFELDLYLKHREYRACIGVIVVFTLLGLKMSELVVF